MIGENFFAELKIREFTLAVFRGQSIKYALESVNKVYVRRS